MSDNKIMGHDAPVIPGMDQEGEKLASEFVTDDTLMPTGHAAKPAVSDSSRAGRPTSYKVEDFDRLTGREEDWRFTPLKRLGGLHTEALTQAGLGINIQAPTGVTVETVDREDARIGSAGIPEDIVAANAWSHFTEATVVTVAQETELDEHINISIEGKGEKLAAQHIVVETKPFSKAVVVLRHTGDAVVSQNVEFIVGDSSELTVITLQQWEDTAIHASAQYAHLGRDARFKHVNVSLGGDLVRVTPSTKFSAPGAETEMYGLYFVDAGQHLENRLFVDHSVPNCKSRVTYKGALQGKNAHSVWVGDVLIGKEAEGTDTYELNRNLLLEDGPRADSVPNLEIETGLIAGAGHASTTGQLDPEHLWYLQARGLTQPEARRLVVRGFLNEIIQQIGIESLETELMDALEAELALSNN
ncbi:MULTISPECIES: Fe-S cluster assembly protein SufD [unclassified Rothia (in: high G+C Gram-positive bacteria)]|uniref:Fe-S cluster assembly protein SufD n=1 Tax=unclassified Rothia (in: high G+C Gram-positive bacteria) TaxID=2689056 RepID=UPI00195B40A8|nr:MULTISPECIES: Fe-S cluster assembly protein SufD [unclassified Rothia (in: high G+C Gram-positive bacteria)]MBM7050595.1 Fe-S cluster assembly protein SufD [Rothia sp. ZJ1223]QRZ60790.1 Fe-S cluster assembly protein SufD [Rothia sp. ZJ932]